MEVGASLAAGALGPRASGKVTGPPPLANNLSGKDFCAKSNCDRTKWPKDVGGYIRGLTLVGPPISPTRFFILKGRRELGIRADNRA